MGFFTNLKWHLENLTKKRLSQSEAHDFWRNPTSGNKPEYYASDSPFSPFLVELIQDRVEKTDSILEIGCNCGRNLEHLRQVGYTNLAGIEINPGAIQVMNEQYEELSATMELHNAPVEEVVPGFKDDQFDLIFTIGVLEHIHRDSDFIFPHIARAAKRFVVTIEEEQGISKRHFPRNYKKVMEPLGFREVHSENCDDRPELRGSERPYIARVFEKA